MAIYVIEASYKNGYQVAVVCAKNEGEAVEIFTRINKTAKVDSVQELKQLDKPGVKFKSLLYPS